MSARRSQLGLAAASLVLIVILASLFAGRGGGGLEGETDLAGGQGPASAVQPIEVIAPTFPSGDFDTGTGVVEVLFDREMLLPQKHGEVADRLDLLVVDQNGVGLLDRTKSPLTPEVIFWLAPVLFPGRSLPATVPPEAQRLRRSGSRVSSTPGWVTSFDRPPEDAYAALLYGDNIVCAEPVLPGQREVVLVATEADIAALQCVIRGRIIGLSPAWHHVRLQPIGREGQVLSPILAGGEGDRFQIENIPPGRAQLLVRFDPGILVQELIQAAPPGTPVSLGSRVVDAEQWGFRMEALRQIRQPWFLLDVELAPGEDRDLGDLVESEAGALLLALVDGAGDPLEAHNADVQFLTVPGPSIPSPQTWSFRNLAMLHPLPVSELQVTVVQGDLGALLTVRPSALGRGGSGVGFPETLGVLSPLSVVALPEEGSARLLTEAGAELVSDPRWSGGRFKGRQIDASTRLVPAGRYRLERGDDHGVFTSVNVAPGTFVDLRHSGAVSTPLGVDDRKSRAADGR